MKPLPNSGKLLQLHWQYKNGTSEMRTQREISSIEELLLFVRETQNGHPLPEGAQWLACNEKSEYFWKTTKEQP